MLHQATVAWAGRRYGCKQNPLIAATSCDRKLPARYTRTASRASVLFAMCTQDLVRDYFYPTLHRLNVARRNKKLPSEFWDSHQKLNETLASFAYAPQIDLGELPDGERVSWTLITEDNRIVIPPVQIRWFVQLIEQGAILKIRRCKQCTSWFFAHFSHQEFCKTPCRIAHFAASEKFKEKRRKYMRDYYRLRRSGKVK